MTVRILVGHVLDRLRGLPAESVHCVVTSPPYYGLRDYGIEPQVWGAGAGLDCVEHEWGDSVAGVKRSGGTASSTLGLASGGHDLSDDARIRSIARSFHEGSSSVFCLRCDAWRGSLGLEPTLALYLDHMVDVFREVRRVMRKDATCWLNIGDSYSSVGPKPDSRLKPKDLMMIPARLAIRLQDDGWWVRSDIAWCKRAPMPESCTDRPTSAWEHVFLLTKSARYYYDAEAVKEPGEMKPQNRFTDGKGPKAAGYAAPAGMTECLSRNQRNVWLLGPEPFPEAHFATFPTEIPRRAILAGTSERGVCPKCAAPWERITRRDFQPTQDPQFPKGGQKGMDASNQWGETPRGINEVETLGWRPTCGCDAGDLVPATVLDPFLGAGTTALVADRLGRDCIGIELNPEYAAMARSRIGADAPLLAEVAD